MATKKKKTATESKPAPEAPEKQSSLKKNFWKLSKTAGIILAIVIFGLVALVTSIIVMVHTSNLRASRAEYDYLREIAGDAEAGAADPGMSHLSALDREMLQINPDYVAWLRIDGTSIDYPVVRGSDNDKYLNISFSGEENIAGAIFMDYRITGDLTADRAGERIPHIIIYGHNLQQGGMFTDLRSFLAAQFLEDNNIITLTVNDQTIRYEIFSARLSSIEDHAYFLNFEESHQFPRFADRIDAPLAATQIITLSTCTRGGSDDARLIVQGYRID